MLQRLSLFIGRAFTFSPEDLRREDGQTTLEYTVVAVLVVVMAGVVFIVFSQAVQDAIGKIGVELGKAITNLGG